PPATAPSGTRLGRANCSRWTARSSSDRAGNSQRLPAGGGRRKAGPTGPAKPRRPVCAPRFLVSSFYCRPREEHSMFSRNRWGIFLACAAAVAISTPPARADGRIDPDTVIAIPHGTFGGVKYVRYEAMFEGVASGHHPYRVPCQIIAPLEPEDNRGLVLFDWINTTGVSLGGSEIPLARYMITDDFLFGVGAA